MNWKLIEDKSWCSLEQQFEWVREMNTVQQDIRYHAEGSVAERTRMVLEALQQSSAYHSLSTLEKELIWTSALLHDVEKRSTSVDEGEGRVSAKGHARKGEYTVRTILYRDCPAPFHIREQIASLVRYHGLPVWLMEKPDSVRFSAVNRIVGRNQENLPLIMHVFITSILKTVILIMSLTNSLNVK